METLIIGFAVGLWAGFEGALLWASYMMDHILKGSDNGKTETD